MNPDVCRTDVAVMDSAMAKESSKQTGLTVWITNDDPDREYVHIHTDKPALWGGTGPNCWYSEHGYMKLCTSSAAKAAAPYKLPHRWKCKRFTAWLEDAK